MKCRAFVGDASRTFEHHYESREPFGLNSFCRLSDKIRDDDSVVCGVEFLEVRQEKPVRVHGGAFGNITDHLKISINPNVNGMDTVRELREDSNNSMKCDDILNHSRGGKHRHITGAKD